MPLYLDLLDVQPAPVTWILIPCGKHEFRQRLRLPLVSASQLCPEMDRSGTEQMLHEASYLLSQEQD